MDKELKTLNKLIKVHIGEHGKADEKLFNFGVELGRLLERNKADKHRLPFFVEQEEKNNQVSGRKARIDAVNKIVQNLIKMAHVEQIRTEGQIHYETGWRSTNRPLTTEIQDKYHISYNRISQTNVGGDFDITFELNGKLKEIFQKHKVGLEVEATLSNSSGEDDEYIHTEDDANSSFYITSIQLYAHNDNRTVEQVDAFATDVEKFYTIFCLKLT